MNSILHDEIIIEILKKASLKSLHRLKWVSKSWYSLINNEVLLPQVLKYPNPWIYYKYRNDETFLSEVFLSLVNPNDYHTLENEMCSKSLDFLPGNRTILDSRNGLIFCCNSDRYFVCNPVDKTYHEISGIDRHLAFHLLDFNPLKSAHYKLVLVEWSALSGALEFNVYHSNKKHFQKELVHVQHLFHLDCIRSNIALWNGYVYLVCGLAADPSKGSVCKVLKISGVLQGGGDRQSISYGFIKFPQRISLCRKGELCSYMGTWRGKLRFVSISAQRIKVWALRNTNEDEWTLEHDCAATFLGLSGNFWENTEKLHIAGFHPTRNVLLIMFKHLLYAYDFDQSSYGKYCEFENDRVLPWSVFSFSPCFAKKVLA